MQEIASINDWAKYRGNISFEELEKFTKYEQHLFLKMNQMYSVFRAKKVNKIRFSIKEILYRNFGLEIETKRIGDYIIFSFGEPTTHLSIKDIITGEELFEEF